MKAVLISIQPKWCEKIFNGEKTIEVRKTRPNIETPFKSYIYCTKGKSRLISVQKDGDIDYYGEVYHGKTLFIKCPQILWNKKCENICGKVIGSFVCDRIEKFSVGSLHCDDIEKESCLSYSEMINYFYKPEELDGKTVKWGFGWHISDLKIYDKPRKLGEFRKPCVDEYQYCQGCRYGNIVLPPDEEEYALYHGGSYENFDVVCQNRLTRPPQSWCYIEV